MCTVTALEEIPFRSDETRAMGRILGSADLIAQMADRTYLEKFPLLFEEFQEEVNMPGLNILNFSRILESSIIRW